MKNNTIEDILKELKEHNINVKKEREEKEINEIWIKTMVLSMIITAIIILIIVFMNFKTGGEFFLYVIDINNHKTIFETTMGTILSSILLTSIFSSIYLFLKRRKNKEKLLNKEEQTNER